MVLGPASIVVVPARVAVAPVVAAVINDRGCVIARRLIHHRRGRSPVTKGINADVDVGEGGGACRQREGGGAQKQYSISHDHSSMNCGATGIRPGRRKKLPLAAGDLLAFMFAMSEYLVRFLSLLVEHHGIQPGEGARQLLDVIR